MTEMMELENKDIKQLLKYTPSSTSLIIREMQIITRMRSHLTLLEGPS